VNLTHPADSEPLADAVARWPPIRQRDLVRRVCLKPLSFGVDPAANSRPFCHSQTIRGTFAVSSGKLWKNQPPEVLIFRQQDAIIAGGLLDYFGILGSMCVLAHRQDIVAITS